MEENKPIDGAEYITLEDAKRLKLPYFEGAAPGFHRLVYIPADNLLVIAVRYHREVAEVVAAVRIPDGDIRDVCHPDLILAYRHDVLYQIRIRRKSVRGVRRAGTTPGNPHVQAVAGYYCLHFVTPHHIFIVGSKAVTIHIMQFVTTQAWIYLTDILYKLYHHLLLESLLAQSIPVLIICLPALAKQPAEKAHGLAFDLLCGKLCYCLAPAFFLIGMLNIFSASSIITSLA